MKVRAFSLAFLSVVLLAACNNSLYHHQHWTPRGGGRLPTWVQQVGREKWSAAQEGTGDLVSYEPPGAGVVIFLLSDTGGGNKTEIEEFSEAAAAEKKYHGAKISGKIIARLVTDAGTLVVFRETVEPPTFREYPQYSARYYSVRGGWAVIGFRSKDGDASKVRLEDMVKFINMMYQANLIPKKA